MTNQILPSPASIEVGENTSPVLDFQMFDAYGAEVDITGDAFQLTVRFLDLVYPDDTVTRQSWELAGTIVTAASGTFGFTLTTEHTTLVAGSYPCEIAWWSSGVTTEPPRERFAGTFKIVERLDAP